MNPSAMFDPEVVAELRERFDKVDADKSGTIDANEAAFLFENDDVGASAEDRRKLASRMMMQLDEDKNGEISFDEFCFRFGRKLQMERNAAKRRNSGGSSGQTTGTSGTAEQSGQILTGSGTSGEKKTGVSVVFAAGDAVRVEGLASAGGKVHNGRKGVILKPAGTDSGEESRFEVELAAADGKPSQVLSVKAKVRKNLNSFINAAAHKHIFLNFFVYYISKSFSSEPDPGLRLRERR